MISQLIFTLFSFIIIVQVKIYTPQAIGSYWQLKIKQANNFSQAFNQLMITTSGISSNIELGNQVDLEIYGWHPELQTLLQKYSPLIASHPQNNSKIQDAYKVLKITISNAPELDLYDQIETRRASVSLKVEQANPALRTIMQINEEINELINKTANNHPITVTLNKLVPSVKIENQQFKLTLISFQKMTSAQILIGQLIFTIIISLLSLKQFNSKKGKLELTNIIMAFCFLKFWKFVDQGLSILPRILLFLLNISYSQIIFLKIVVVASQQRKLSKQFLEFETIRKILFAQFLILACIHGSNQSDLILTGVVFICQSIYQLLKAKTNKLEFRPVDKKTRDVQLYSLIAVPCVLVYLEYLKESQIIEFPVQQQKIMIYIALCTQMILIQLRYILGKKNGHVGEVRNDEQYEGCVKSLAQYENYLLLEWHAI